MRGHSTKKRRRPNMTERLAATLLLIKRGEEWLIPEPLRSTGSPAEIVKFVEWDHKHMHAMGGDESPQNMQPLSEEEHKAKTKRDVARLAKERRQAKKHEEARRKMLARETGELEYVKAGKRKSQCEYTRLKHLFRRKPNGSVVPRWPKQETD